MRRIRIVSSIVMALLLMAAPAWAATISGTISADATGSPLMSMEVRAWVLPAGNPFYVIEAMDVTDAAGSYSLTVPAGDYKVDARMSPGFVGNYGDRWYDVVVPDSGGYIMEDADILTVGAATNLTGINIALEILGGLDGRAVTSGGVGVGAVLARAERNADPRIHHNDLAVSLPAELGNIAFRGMLPATDYQIWVYDPMGVYDTGLFPGPFTVITNTNGVFGDLTIVPYATDPFEPNPAPSCSPPAVDYSGFLVQPPIPWSSSGTYIGPAVSNDIDWHCVDALAGDRFFATASTELMFGGAVRYHPWTDPILSFWSGAAMLLADDDSGPGPLDSWLDTGPVASSGCYCFLVSTFGDSGDGVWDGIGQGSTGDYILTVEMGNRAPTLVVTESGVVVPLPPGALMFNEGDTITLDLVYGDADGDPVALTLDNTDIGGAAVTAGTFSSGGGTGSYVWPVGNNDATGSPYTVDITAADAEFVTSLTVNIIIAGVNFPPTTPTLIDPPDASTVASNTPTLTLGNSTDADGDPITYEIELYYADPASAVAQTLMVAEMAGGMTSTVPGVIPENTLVHWRARATDGMAGGTSLWTPFNTFTVDNMNDPPLDVVLVKPFDNETVLVRRPGMSATNTIDPEGGAVTLFFQVATDAAFMNVVTTSPGVPQDTLSTTTVWTVDVDLDWGGVYYARAWAEDDGGAASAYSNVHQFDVKENVVPDAPLLVEPLECFDVVYPADAPPNSFTVSNVSDPEMEGIVFELEIHRIEDDPEMTPPLIMASAAQLDVGTTTDITFDGSVLEPGQYSYRIRATDGTDASEWIQCNFWVGDPGMMKKMPPPKEDPPGGCGCRIPGESASFPPAALLVLLPLALVVARRRRRRRPSR